MKIRRTDRQIEDPQKIRSILEECHVCRLGLIDEAGPYVVPVNFGWVMDGEKLTLYFHGALEGRKIKIIKSGKTAAFEMDCRHELISGGPEACRYSFRYQSLIGTGIPEIINDPREKENALLSIMRHETGRTDFLFSPASLDRTAVYKLVSHSYSGKEPA